MKVGGHPPGDDAKGQSAGEPGERVVRPRVGTKGEGGYSVREAAGLPRPRYSSRERWPSALSRASELLKRSRARARLGLGLRLGLRHGLRPGLSSGFSRD